MSQLVLLAYWRLIYFDWVLSRQDFSLLYERLHCGCPRPKLRTPEAIAKVCEAVDFASIWYWKKVLCLQRSAATVSLLRHEGVSAQLVIGARQIPFRAHAWVEVDGRVVNDKPYVREMYAALDKC